MSGVARKAPPPPDFLFYSQRKGSAGAGQKTCCGALRKRAVALWARDFYSCENDYNAKNCTYFVQKYPWWFESEPDASHEAVRDPVRAREAAAQDLRQKRQQLLFFTRISQCAPKARITSGGRFHPESCR